MNKATKGLKLVLKEMKKSKERLEKKAEKELKKLDEIYVTVKGEKVYKEKDLWDLFESDVINGNQYDTYRDKLEQKRLNAGESDRKTPSEEAVQILNNIISNLMYEIQEEQNVENI